MDPAVKLEQEAMRFVKPIDEATDRGGSDVQQFYQDAVIFLTGGTGFLGKQLLEKLFRSCNIKKAFVLIRPKKGIPTAERLHDMLSDPVFQPVLTKKPDLPARIVCVEGDVADIRLGIQDHDWDMVVQETDIVFHAAATVRFDEKIRAATKINVQGTREALRLGSACKKLRAFVHISTTYSGATADRRRTKVWEKFYESPVPAKTLLTLVDTVSEERLDAMTQSLISGWPNTYTFTKAVAEELVREQSGKLPACVVRPSIVLGSYREPIPGWLDEGTRYGLAGIVLGAMLGVIRVFYVDNSARISFVPVDLVNNAAIVAGWQAGARGLQPPAVYNVSSTRCGVTLRHLSRPLRDLRRVLTTPAAVWYCYLVETDSRFFYWFLSWILHYIPAYIADVVSATFKIQKPIGLNSFIYQYRKFDKLADTISYFTTNEWIFDDTALQNLWRTMSSTDRTIYNFNVDSIDWDHNGMMMAIGIRKYIIKDGLKGTEKAVARQQWLKLANYAVLFAYFAVFCVVLWWFGTLML